MKVRVSTRMLCVSSLVSIFRSNWRSENYNFELCKIGHAFVLDETSMNHVVSHIVRLNERSAGLTANFITGVARRLCVLSTTSAVQPS